MNTDINYVFKKWTSVEATHEKLFGLSNRQTKKYLSMNIWSSFIRYSLNLWNKINIPTYPTTVLTLTHERAYSNFFHCKMAWGMFSKKYYNITIHSTPQFLSFSSMIYYWESLKLVLCFYQYSLALIFVDFEKTHFQGFYGFLDNGHTKKNGWHISYFDKYYILWIIHENQC